MLIALVAAAPVLASASDLGKLARQGYAVVAEPRIEGAFEGCQAGRRTALENRQELVCTASSFGLAFRPVVLVLKQADRAEVKVLVDGQEQPAQPQKPGEGC
jgi:hypothetical protein